MIATNELRDEENGKSITRLFPELSDFVSGERTGRLLATGSAPCSYTGQQSADVLWLLDADAESGGDGIAACGDTTPGPVVVAHCPVFHSIFT